MAFILIIVFMGCQKNEYANPYDSTVSPDIWAPQNLLAEQTSLTSTELKWTQREQRIDSFKIEVKRGDADWQVLGYTHKDNMIFVDKAFIPDPIWKIKYRVSAVAWQNFSSYSESTVVPVFAKPVVPIVLRDLGVRIKITWWDIYTNEDGYKLEKTVNGVNWILCSDTIKANSTFYYDNSPELNTQITYRLRARVKGLYSDTTSGNKISTVIAPPSGVALTSLGLTSCRIDWTQADSWTAGYKVDRQIGDNPWQVGWLNLDKATTTFTDTNLPLDQDTRYRVSTRVNSSYSLPDELLYGLAFLDTVTTSNATYSSVNLKTNGIKDGGTSITEWGIVYATTLNPTTATSKLVANTAFNAGYTTTLSGLDNAKTYYIRAYALNRRGVSYGPQKSFIPVQFTLPQMGPTAVELLYSIFINITGAINKDGGTQIIEAGFYYSTKPGVTSSDMKIVINPIKTNGIYSLWGRISNLVPGQRYYIRSFARNSVGMVLGDEIFFTTLN